MLFARGSCATEASGLQRQANASVPPRARRIPVRTIAWFAAAAMASGCTLDTEGEGAFASAGGTGGAGGSSVLDSSAGSGGSVEAGAGGASTGGTAGADAAAGSGGTQNTGGVAGDAATGGADSGPDVVVETGPDTLLVEDCFNGVDDDADGAADCADSDCSAVVMCVPITQIGWSAPGFLRSRAEGEPPADCGGLQLVGTFHQTFSSGGASCVCGCGNATGGVCAGGSATLYDSADCSSLTSGTVGGTGCYSVSSGAGNVAASAIGTPADPSSMGTCAPAVSASIGLPTWSDAAEYCATGPAFGGCGAQAVCVPRPPTGFAPEACVLAAGTQTCPSAYPVSKTWYTSLSDNRACTAAGCSCGLPTGGKCGGTMRFHSDPSCGATTTVRSFPLDGTCKNLQLSAGEAKSLDFSATGPAGGKCVAAGVGTVTGTVAPSGANTICCQASTN